MTNRRGCLYADAANTNANANAEPRRFIAISDHDVTHNNQPPWGVTRVVGLSPLPPVVHGSNIDSNSEEATALYPGFSVSDSYDVGLVSWERRRGSLASATSMETPLMSMEVIV